ncbi:archease [Candidatus Woesearchaeota archaeon]|nr:archease [Candidatus Woesearchaeota archaeon]|tara:strand:- start:18663 stop:19076 length:414 start_codon:yes stop_codon:yes gene_type:complete
MQKYKFINDLTSDVLFEAYGKSLKEVFENAALALFSVICQIKKVNPKDIEEFEIKGDNEEELMFNWLQGLIAIVDTEQKFFSKVEIEEIDKTHVTAKLYGEPITPEKGETVVKAVTNYKYSFKKTKDGYKAVVSLDI